MNKEKLIKNLVDNYQVASTRIQDRINEYRRNNRVDIINPVMLGRYFNFKMYQSDLSSYDGLQGFCVLKKDTDEKIVYVESSLPEENRREVLAHEVIHLLMLPDRLRIEENIILDKYNAEINYNENQRKIEKLCNQYMRDILMPERVFKEEYDYAYRNISNYKKHLSSQFGVRIELIEERISELHIS